MPATPQYRPMCCSGASRRSSRSPRETSPPSNRPEMPAQRRIILGSALAAPFIRTARADPIKLRVSLDATPSHGRTVSIADFLKKLEAASQGEIATQLFDSGQLFAD